MSRNRLALIVAMSFCSLTACSPARSPNIILITVDTLRADRLGCYGHEPARTPNIDRLATEGIRVEHAIAPTPLTLPSPCDANACRSARARIQPEHAVALARRANLVADTSRRPGTRHAAHSKTNV